MKCRYVKFVIEYNTLCFDGKITAQSYRPQEINISLNKSSSPVSRFIDLFVANPKQVKQLRGMDGKKAQVYLDRLSDEKCKIINLSPQEIDISSLILLYIEQNVQNKVDK